MSDGLYDLIYLIRAFTEVVVMWYITFACCKYIKK